jgi:hypothetical protein
MGVGFDYAFLSGWKNKNRLKIFDLSGFTVR